MGLFQHKPEEPTEWAGLPGEPWEPRGPADRLDDVPTADLPLFGTAGSISIVEIPVEVAPPTPSGEGDEPSAASED
jgi:hypothetical protein